MAYLVMQAVAQAQQVEETLASLVTQAVAQVLVSAVLLQVAQHVKALAHVLLATEVTAAGSTGGNGGLGRH